MDKKHNYANERESEGYAPTSEQQDALEALLGEISVTDNNGNIAPLENLLPHLDLSQVKITYIKKQGRAEHIQLHVETSANATEVTDAGEKILQLVFTEEYTGLIDITAAVPRKSDQVTFCNNAPEGQAKAQTLFDALPISAQAQMHMAVSEKE